MIIGIVACACVVRRIVWAIGRIRMVVAVWTHMSVVVVMVVTMRTMMVVVMLCTVSMEYWLSSSNITYVIGFIPWVGL